MAVSECIAFKAERNGFRAEVAIWTNAPSWKVIRVNNARQLGLSK